MPVIVNNLILEVTRRCNAKCEHCLRGDAQKIDMSKKVIDRVLTNVADIGTIQFSGGEPSLAVPVLRYCLRAIKARKITVGNFFMYTNGKIASLRLVHALLDFYAYCGDPENLNGLQISCDQFHRKAIKSTKQAQDLYKGLAFFHLEKDDPNHRLFDDQIYYEGRAIENGLGRKDVNLTNCRIESSSENGDLHIEGELYINALGDVLPACDLSYEHQEEVKIGNVLDKPLAEIFAASDVNPKNLIEDLAKRVA